MGGEDLDARELRRRTVARILEDFGSASFEEREGIDDAIRHMYSPDLKNGWGIHVVQEVKLLAKKEDRFAFDSAIDELVHLDMQRTSRFATGFNPLQRKSLDSIVDVERLKDILRISLQFGMIFGRPC